MDILEHPLEAVAFRLYSVPDASGATAWTCLAAVLAAAAAAAAGLWRLRSCAPAAGTTALKPLDFEPPKAMEISQNTAGSSSARSSSPDSAASTTVPAPLPKERYTAYYRDNARLGFCDLDEYEEAEAEEQGEGGVHDQASETTADPFGWEVVRSLRPLRSPTTTTELGRYRSPTALISGSVVRLWDEAVVDASVTVAWSPLRSSRYTVSAF